MNPLPRLHAWLIRYEVRKGGILPPLPTTAFHGALARALYDKACVAPARATCTGCPAEPCCAYPALFEPAPAERSQMRELGVTTEVPRPLVISPDQPFLPTGEEPLPVRAGQIVAFRIAATDKVWHHWNLLRQALDLVGRRGLGARETRVLLRLIDVQALASTPPNFDGGGITLRFVTPLRIKHRGKIASEIDGPLLVSAILRRARLLAELTGKPWVGDDRAERWAASLESVADLKLVRVGRYSGRQERWMLWPGLVGSLRLRGEGLGALLPLLHFGSLAQIGKATTFGFGRYELSLAAEAHDTKTPRLEGA
ncbi:hypothetical protein HRbin30_01677 [bacterium HR30]|nr:hypothetical protein HRbin30_01677 [bacterium HR30]